MHDFGNSNPHAPQSQTLSAPLPQRQQDLAIKREQARRQAARQAKTEKNQIVSKTIPNNAQAEKRSASQIQGKQMNSQTPVTPANQAAANKGIESMRDQAAAKTQSAASTNTAQPGHNKGIEAARQKASTNQSGVNSSQSTKQGIKNYQNKASGQSAGSSKSGTDGTAKRNSQER